MIQGYRRRKKNKKPEFRMLGKETAIGYSENYDPATGAKLDDTATQLNIKGLENDLANIRKQIAELQELEKDAVELIADLKAEAAKTNTPK